MEKHPIPLKNHANLSKQSKPPFPIKATVNCALLKRMTLSQGTLLKALGFLNPEKVIKHMQQVSTGSVSLSNIQQEHIFNEGETATMAQQRHHKEPVEPSYHYSDRWSLDIGFGPGTSIGGVRYTLLVVDKATKLKKMYPLKNLTTSLLRAIKIFVLEVGIKPKLLHTDFDRKITGGSVKAFLDEAGIPIEAAPPGQQNQNGLVECHWKNHSCNG